MSETIAPLEIRPVVLINKKLGANTVPEVVKQIERFDQIDDVCSGQFAITLVVQADPTNAFTNLVTQPNSSGQILKHLPRECRVIDSCPFPWPIFSAGPKHPSSMATLPG